MMDFSRRDLWTSMAALWLGFGLPAGAAEASESDDARILLGLLDDRPAAALLGSSWLKQTNGELSPPAAIVDRLTQGLRQQGWTGRTDNEELRRRLSAAVQQDFRTGAVVTIDGWQIARTQAELCALAYLASVGQL